MQDRRRSAVLVTLLLVAGAARSDTSGLDTRPGNTTCLAPPRPTGSVSVTTEDAFPAAPDFAEPTKILQAPDDGSRWFVLERTGRIKVFSVANPAGAAAWLDFSSQVQVSPGGEDGLLGMAFHPGFPTIRVVYVSYTAPGAPTVSRISRVVLDNTTAPQDIIEDVVLTVSQPTPYHNGGDIAFGPDGHLYIGLGDGGTAGDSDNHAQNTSDLLGDFLRIKVLGIPFDQLYQIPADNPFAGNPKCGPAGNAQDCPEIYAWGFRNPWRWNFDRQAGTLWAGDVGENSREEVDIVERGGNYGWRCREGTQYYNPAGCPAGGLIDPVVDYDRTVGGTVIGGFVYRGTAIPALAGRYVFGDFGPGWIAALQDDGAGGYVQEILHYTGAIISAFGEDQDRELYFTDYFNGRIRKLVPATGGPQDTIPANLADTGCVNPSDPTQPASGLIPYDINAPFWSDGAAKERWIGLPDGMTITMNSATDWGFPAGTVIMKNFRLAGQLIETRLLMRHPDGLWRGYTYEWNDAGTAATRVAGGKSRVVAGQAWIYPSEGQCLQCHTSAAGFSLGLETAQLNRSFTYPSTGRTANQLTTLDHIGMFTAPLQGTPSTLPRFADPADVSRAVHARARAWLHTNCSQCHRPGGPTPFSMDLRYTTALQNMNACEVAPGAGDLGIPDARLLSPGDAAHSVVPARMGRRDALGMPPLASNIVDSQGVSLVNGWINSLGSCQDTDNDGPDDSLDNCLVVANETQRDTDGDGYGNACDGDLNNSGFVNAADTAILRLRFGTTNAHADLNGDGVVNAADLARFRTLFGHPPGPSALHP